MHCPLWFSFTNAMVQIWPTLHLYAFFQMVFRPNVSSGHRPGHNLPPPARDLEALDFAPEREQLLKYGLLAKVPNPKL